MKNSPLLCFPSETTIKHIEKLKEELKSFSNFNAENNYISPLITKQFPEKSLKVRLSILKKVYKGDYFTDSYDISRIVKRIQDGDEQIWFWGSSHEIENLNSYFHSGLNCIAHDFSLGSVTAINVENEFGQGVAELCRSGSTDFIITGRPPIIYRTLGYLLSDEKDLHNKYHTLCLVPRTRKSETNIRGGEAVKTIHTKYLQSRFWGYAPWYVMQGGVLEMLEYREINRDVQDVISAIKSNKVWYISNSDEAQFVRNLCRINFNIFPEIINAPISYESKDIMGILLSVNDENIKEFNHETIICASKEVVTNNHKQYPFKKLLFNLLKSQCSCKVIRLNLTNMHHCAIQEEIRKLGFKLTMISPPKNSWFIDGSGQKQTVEIPPYGFWCLPNPALTIALPYYINFGEIDVVEYEILSYVKTHILVL